MDPYRGTTVLPYLEVFYNYEGQGNVNPTRWDSQDDEVLFDTNDSRSLPSASQSLASVSHERSMETISGRRSRVSSQENGRLISVYFCISKQDISVYYLVYFCILYNILYNSFIL